MLKNREKEKRQIYEEPSVCVAYIEENDVLRTSTDVGVEFPGDGNGGGMWG